MRLRAVIFDLWQTLVDWPVDDSRVLRDAIRASTGHGAEEFERLWWDSYRQRETGPLADAYRAIGVPDESIGEFVRRRYENTRRALVPREGALETLDELRRRGYRTGLISVCAEDVPAIWDETPFAGRFDALVFSARCGYMKPEPEIYRLALQKLDVEPHEAVFVGDGANDELGGAERVGIRAVLIHAPGEDPPWPEVRGWSGPRITAIPELLELLESNEVGAVA